MQGAEPAAGVLYLVGTPIGNLADLSPRARQVLAGVSRIACEDTRRSGLLLHQLGLRQKDQGPRLVSFHAHNQTARIPELLAALAAGEALAVISDAGLPGISDPGEALVAAARTAGLAVICVPGPSAVTTALVSSGLPSGRFCFEGFLPPKATQRRQRADGDEKPRRLVIQRGAAKGGGTIGLAGDAHHAAIGLEQRIEARLHLHRPPRRNHSPHG